MTGKPPAPPRGTGAAGKRLWGAVLAEFAFDEHELALLRQAVRCLDDLDRLNAIVRKEGLVVRGKSGPRMHPAQVEARQLRLVLARILAALRLPSGLTAGGKSPQRRVGARGVYRLRGIA